jgi:hypothetical protein
LWKANREQHSKQREKQQRETEPGIPVQQTKKKEKPNKLNHQNHYNLNQHKTTETGNDKQLEVVVNPPRVMLSSA